MESRITVNRALLLDVDGVLVHSGSVMRGRESGEPASSSFFYAAQIDSGCAARVARILAATDARLVVISTWRTLSPQMGGLERALRSAGVSRERLRNRSVTGKAASRRLECEAWLADHPEVTRVLVVDDGTVNLDWEVPGLLRPNWFTGGLQEEAVEPMIHFLLDDTPNRFLSPPVSAPSPSFEPRLNRAARRALSKTRSSS